MKMRIGYAVKSRTGRCLSGCLRNWQRALLGLYVILFALVLPFICWGAAAEPSHPHRLPHFVFATPVLATPVVQIHDEQHGASHGTAPMDGKAIPAERLPADAPIPGRSTPKLLIFSILLLVFLCAGLARQFDLHHFAIALRHHFPESILLAVPIRPPRLAAL